MADSNSVITGRTRVNLSALHLSLPVLKTGAYTEEQNNGKELGAFWEDIFADATASLMIAAAALESCVNELIGDHETHFPSLRTDLLTKIWEAHETKPFPG